jgi:hypothetical protein
MGGWGEREREGKKNLSPCPLVPLSPCLQVVPLSPTPRFPHSPHSRTPPLLFIPCQTAFLVADRQIKRGEIRRGQNRATEFR